MADSRSQKAGDNAQQLQAGTVNIYNGIDEKRAREIYEEKYTLAKQEFTAEAISIANNRIGEFEKSLMSKMIAIDGALEAFADPGFQLLLVKAQKTAAATERSPDYNLLSELLIHRFQKGNNRKTRAGIERAVEIVDKIDDAALLGLTVFHSIAVFRPVTGDILQGLDVLNDLFGKIIYDTLPVENDWLEHLDVLDAIRISSFGNLKKIQQYYPEELEGYVAVGIEKESTEHQKAIDILTHAALPYESILVDHVLNNNYLRINIPNRETIDSGITIKILNHGILISSIAKFSADQNTAIKSIYDLYKNDDTIKKQNIDKFMEEWDKRENLKNLRVWWDNIETSFQITSVGRVLAHSNAQRCNKSLPQLN
jgi:hypothetical protein